MRRRLVAGFVLVPLVAVGIGTASPGQRRPPSVVFAVEQDLSGERIGDAYHLVRADPITLERLGSESFSLAGTGQMTTSPDRRYLAFGSNSSGRGRERVRFVDGLRLRGLGSSPVHGFVQFLQWTPSNHVFAVGADFVSLLDPTTRRVTWSRLLGGIPITQAATPSGIVLLRAPTGRIGRATLLVADARRGLRRTRLAITAGSVPGPDRQSRSVRRPALAVDSARRRAFVVDGDRGVAIVDLTSLRVRYVPLRNRVLPEGERESVRWAYWTGNGTLAVSGWDTGRTEGLRPAGFRLVRVRDGSVRTIDGRVHILRSDGRSLLAYAEGGFTAYAPDATRRFFVAMPSPYMTIVGRYGYILPGSGEPSSRRTIVDLDTGAIVGRPEPRRWTNPMAEAAP